MKRTFVALSILLLLAVLAGCAPKADATVGSIQILSPWIRAAANGGNTAAFMVLKNTGEADQLVKAEFAPAMMIELMDTKMESDKMAMVTIPTIDLPGNAETTLKSGGLHIMLMKLKQPLKAGEKYTLTLTFAKAGTVTLEVPVKE